MKINYRGTTVKVPVASVEPTVPELIRTALSELGMTFGDLPGPDAWQLTPVGPDEDLEFHLEARR